LSTTIAGHDERDGTDGLLAGAPAPVAVLIKTWQGQNEVAVMYPVSQGLGLVVSELEMGSDADIVSEGR
jgi:hypothetical protein